MNSKCDTSVLPNNIFSLQGDEFFRCIEQLAGGMLCAILKIQLIDSTQALMNSTDLFDIFLYNSPKINCLRDKVYFRTENGDYILKSGITTNLSLLRNLLNAKKEEQQNSHYNQQQEQISINLINNNPMLKSLFRWYEQNEKVENKEQTFLKTFIDTITNNLTKSPNNYRYSESVEQFALSLYILGGKMTYQFVRMNLSPALPSVQTLDKLISNDDSKINEAQFRFDKLQEYFDRINVKYAFGSEDCTGVIRRINYDQQTNSFIGFASPLINGIPVAKHYQTNSFDQLKSWFSSSDKSPLLNIHMIQPLQPENHLAVPAAFLLSGYGVVNTYTSMDILRRWLFIFNNCLQKNIRIIGFSTDGDAKYMRAMRLVNGFFASLPHFKLNEHQEAFDLKTTAKWSWFYLRNRQLLLFFQDGIHIVTKWRNRLLSSTAQLRFGRQDISIEHLIDIIEDTNYSKLDHGLTRSDLNPKDRQNYNSCVKIASDDILSILVDGTDTYGTFIYLQLLKMITPTYVKKTTKINERLQSAWCIVFVCRMWWTWIQHKQFTSTTASTTTKRNNKEKFFITKTAYLSVELNAHNLLYMILLVKQRQLPKEALNVYLFNSQHCESMFRNTRSLSGTYSTILNFTVADFLRRSQKISVLNRIKCEQLSQQDDNERLSFPIHHKHNHDNHPSSIQNLDDIDQLDIEKIISDAFNQALQLTERLQISKLLKNMTSLN
ncbi:unnamed protein product [Didymodactylos carnosus]|uniref:THAP9-like helix-turn-helix domain-containing protein n=1 Tax=Didymodactylos carnosus TaxID=1234261 RepID=A0A8S2LRG1_9BILA|nr:unnamed protein product [Didymodactylos carnosus]CAF3919716.1 unnamed protein product [Didymodactylos carnosus]